jgi:hypothetical protein
MTELVNALDNFTPTQRGENEHAEYGYSNSLRERLVQFSFQVTRITKGSSMDAVEKVLRGLLTDLKNDLTNKKWMSGTSIEMLVMLFKMIGHTRDVEDGKGEYALSYMMIYVWEQYWPELAAYALTTFVQNIVPGDNTSSEDADATTVVKTTPYGSWKDIKHFCTYLKGRNHCLEDSLLMRTAVELLNDQLRLDIDALNADENASISLAGKWCPREKSTNNGWLHEVLALDFFSNFLYTAKTPESKQKASGKAKTHYRKMLSRLNAHLGTVQVAQCSKRWSEIKPEEQTSITLFKQKRAFLNKTKKNEVRTDDPDRIACAEHFNEFIAKTATGEVKAKGKRVSMADFTKEAVELMRGQNVDNEFWSRPEVTLLNAQWLNNSEQTGQLGKMIAMVDTSGSMIGDPMNAAIALGIRVADKSILGRRVMTFDSKPAWINLDGCEGFVQCVKMVDGCSWGMSTNFYSALDMILDVIVQKNLGADIVKDMVLAIFSDMQINQGDSSYTSDKTMSERIAIKYAEAGVKVCGVPYTPPHILFWNLRSLSGAPALSTTNNTSMLSGFSPALLNTFCEKGWEELQSATPWVTLKEQIDNPRYYCLQNKCMELVESNQREQHFKP